jgi:glycosyltransferase involved in cell wall biosynthesis
MSALPLRGFPATNARPIRSLAIVTPFYPPHVGGVERYAQEFARAALGLGLSINVVTTASVRKPVEAVEDGGVRVLRLPAFNLPVMGSHYPISVTGWRRAERHLQCEVVMAHTRFFMTTLAASAVTARQSRPLYVVDHGSGPLRSCPRALASASLVYERAVTALLKRRSAKFLAVSAASAEWLRYFDIGDAEVIPNGIAPRAAMPPRNVDAFGRAVILFAGRLIPEKGVRELVKAVESLVREGRNLQLRIAGDGPLSNFVQDRASSAGFLRYLGRLTPAEVAVEMDKATMFVNPSNYPEGLPTTLLEAGAAALPVISTPRGGSGDLIRNGETGWLIPGSTPSHLAAAMREVMAQPDEAIRRGAKLFRLVQADYAWPSIVERFLEHAARLRDDEAAQ